MNRAAAITLGIAGTALVAWLTRKYWWPGYNKGGKADSILFVGDSITVAPYSYGNVIKQKYPNKKIDILAKGGMRTSWMLENLKTQLASNRYDRVYIWGGVNDMFSNVSIDKAAGNIQSMVDMVRAQGGVPYVIIGYDTKNFMLDEKLTPTSYVPTKAGMVALKNDYIRYQNALPSKIKNAEIVKQFNGLAPAASDGFHPGAEVHKQIARIIDENIN